MKFIYFILIFLIFQGCAEKDSSTSGTSSSNSTTTSDDNTNENSNDLTAPILPSIYISDKSNYTKSSSSFSISFSAIIQQELRVTV